MVPRGVARLRQRRVYHALSDNRAAYCAFFFDTDLLDALPRND
jgi:hypothetical protein